MCVSRVGLVHQLGVGATSIFLLSFRKRDASICSLNDVLGCARVHTLPSWVALFCHLRVGKLTPLFYPEDVRMVSSPPTGTRLSSPNHEGGDGGGGTLGFPPLHWARASGSHTVTLWWREARLYPLPTPELEGGARARVGGGGAASAARGGDISHHALSAAHRSLVCSRAPQTQSAAAVCWSSEPRTSSGRPALSSPRRPARRLEGPQPFKPDDELPEAPAVGQQLHCQPAQWLHD